MGERLPNWKDKATIVFILVFMKQQDYIRACLNYTFFM